MTWLDPLDCSFTKLSDLSPLAGLTALASLECWDAQVSELSPPADTVWQAFSPGDRENLLAMMLRCGMAFEYVEAGEGERVAIYIAPDLLPDFADPAVQRWYLREWDPDGASLTCTIPVALLHEGLIRALMVAIGKDAGLWAVYWKGGLLFHDTRTRAIATIEARWPDPDGWAGEIVITAQRSRAGELLTVLERHLRDLADRLGVELGETKAEAAAGDSPGIADDFGHAHGPRSHWASQAGDAALMPGRGRPRVPSCYVSYAWSDGSQQADANARMVDDLCAAAEARGFEIIRDKTHLANGASISAFAEEIARAERVVTLIGARYWTRPDCFAELYGCWAEARQRPELFRQKIREFLFPDTGLHDPDIVLKIARHWEAEFRRCDAMPGTYRDRHAQLIADQADSWAAQCRRIIAALQDKTRAYGNDFEAFKHELFAELEALGYKPDHAVDA